MGIFWTLITLMDADCFFFWTLIALMGADLVFLLSAFFCGICVLHFGFGFLDADYADGR